MPAWLRTVAVAALLVAPLAVRALAAVPGDLDTTFGGGRVIVPFGTEAGAGGVAVQPDGKVVVAGSSDATPGFAVARLLPNGSPDTSFGGTGVVTTTLGKSAGSTDVAVQSDGKIVAVGGSNQDFAIVRYLGNGKLDPSFGEGGVVIMPVGTLGDYATAVAIGPGGPIAVTGTAEVPESGYGAGVAVLRGNGEPEAKFAEDGTTVVTTESSNDDRGEGIAVQGDGRILIADAANGGAGDGFTVVRLGTDGKPDASFGGDGIVETPIPGEGEVTGGRSTDVAIQPDGKIVVGGYGLASTGLPPESVTTFALARYTAEGELDPSFGTGGIVSSRLGVGDDFGRSVAVAADGRLILAGTYDPNPDPLEDDYAPALLRFNANGGLDTTFGSGGAVLRLLPAGTEDESLEGMALQADGRIITTTSEYPTGGPGFAVASRYIADFEKPNVGPPASPSNYFSFGKLTLNKKAGTAKLTVRVPGAGTLVLSGKTVVKQRVAPKQAGSPKLLVKAKGKAKRKLNSAGKVKVKVKVAYTPAGGTVRTKTKTIKLVKRLDGQRR